MKLIDRVVKEEIKNLVRVQDFFDERYDYLRMDKNERLLPFTKKQIAEFRKQVTSEALSGYSELGSTYRAVAKFLKVKEDQILLACGSDLAIKSIFEACVQKGDNIVIHLPSYAMYRVYGKMFGAHIKGVSVKRDWYPDIDAMLKLVDGKTKFMCLENPNGFVGTNLHLEDIKRAAAYLKKKNVLLVLDEAYRYIEHDRSQTISLIRQYPNIVITQTFSKGHGLAGVRAGFLIGDASLMSHIARVRPMHEVPSLTALAIEWALQRPSMMKEYQDSLAASKSYLKKGLSSVGIDYRDTHGNFMLLYMPDEGRTKNMAMRLKAKKILIRRPFEEPFLKGWSRICVGTVVDSKIFIAALRALLPSTKG